MTHWGLGYRVPRVSGTQCPDPDLAKFWLAVRMASSSRLRFCRLSTSSSRASWSSRSVTSDSVSAAGAAVGSATSACGWELGLGLPVAPGAQLTHSPPLPCLWNPHSFSRSSSLHIGSQELFLKLSSIGPCPFTAPASPVPQDKVALPKGLAWMVSCWSLHPPLLMYPCSHMTELPLFRTNQASNWAGSPQGLYP